MSAVQTYTEEPANPLDMIEVIAARYDWVVDRNTEEEINLIVECAWNDLHMCLNWRSDFEALHLACGFDLKVPEPRRAEVARLISMVNEQLLFGHFDLWRTEGSLIFRNGLLLCGTTAATEAQCETLIHLALESCERFYPAFQFVIWAGQGAQQALEACLLETQGEA